MTANLIKEVSLSLFTRDGYEGASLSDIANKVGIHKSSIYTHFKSKENLFLAVFDDAMQDYRNHLEQLILRIQHDSIEQQLYKILIDVGQYFEVSGEKVIFLKRAMLFPPTLMQEELKARFSKNDDNLSQILFSILEQGVKEKHQINGILITFLCVLDGLFAHMVYFGIDGFNEKVNSTWKLLWSGIQSNSMDA